MTNMRKFATYGAAALLVISSAVGISYAQDSTPEPSTTDTAAPPAPMQRTWLGVSVSDTDNGVTIVRISQNSPAETAQLQVDDVITAVNGEAIASASDLQAVIDAAASGDVVTLTIQRGSDELSVDVTLSSREGRGGMFAPLSDPLQAAEMMLDAQLEGVEAGYQVVAVNDNSTFALAAGDVITAINGEAVGTVDWTTLMAPGSDNTVTLTVQRDGAEISLDGQIGFFGGRGGRDGGFPGNGGQNGGPRGGNGGNGQPNGGQNGQAPAAPNGGQPGDNGNGNGGQPPADAGTTV